MVQVKALNCPNCGASIPDTSKACGHCGSRVILSDDRQKFVLAGTICPKCGLDNKEQHRFCSKCGDKLFKECPKCHKEIGLDSIHCPFCGNNIDNAAKERETELTLHQDRLRQKKILEQNLMNLQQKKDPVYREYLNVSRQADEASRRINSFNIVDFSGPQIFLIIYPIGALFLSGLAYFIGFKDFGTAFVVAYIGIFSLCFVLPSNRYQKLKDKADLLGKECEEIDKEIKAVYHEINSLNGILREARIKYKFDTEDL